MKRRMESDLPKDALRTIQEGTVAFTYRGVLCQKNPFDLALYSRLLFETGARSIVEIGSSAGGSALWFADTLRCYGRNPRIVSVDVNPVSGVNDPDVTFAQGTALALGEVLPESFLRELPRPWIVVEDSAHTYEVTRAVLRFFDPWLEVGEYAVVEDGIVNDLEGAEYRAFENGPNRAIFEHLDDRPGRYEIDSHYCDYFGHNFTWNTNGWLRRI